jgi:transposase
MARPSTPIVLSSSGRAELERFGRGPRLQARYAQRAQVVLLAADGLTNKEIAARLGTRPARVSKWRTRFAAEGVNGLCDDFRPGAAPKYDESTERRLLAQLDEPPPAGYARWNGALLAKALGDVSDDQVWRVLRKLGISLQRRRSWCVSTDPQFAAKAADVVGLYLSPPENAVVISVDEKPCIQALERAQGWLKMPDGRALTGFAHEYKRHGTTTLFAALEVATGRVHGACKTRKRRQEFLDFIALLEAAHPTQELHIVLDNLSTHRITDPSFWKKHPRLHFHFTPTHASWLNQIEVWFSILSGQSLRDASFRSAKELVAHIEAYIVAYNENCTPFEWRKVDPEAKSFAGKYSNLCN